MANIAAINTVYNHFVTAYAPEGTNTKYDTHKKSELRGVYNSIVKMNKEAPLFLLDTSAQTQEFAVGLKENARSLKNVISSLSVDDSTEFLDKKSVSSSDDSQVSASYIGAAQDEANVPQLEIAVKRLAQGQVNLGKYLDPDSMDMEPGTYSFDIRSRDMDYEFQFNIGENDTNRTIEEKLARLITKSNIGLSVSVDENVAGDIALKMESDETGVRGDSNVTFAVSDDHTSKQRGIVDYFGIGEPTQMPCNSSFTLNGEERSTFSNHFTVDKLYELSLNGVSPEGESVSIGLKTDVESITENITQLVDGYNSFLNKVSAYLDSQPYSRKLVGEMSSISAHYGSQLSAMGLMVGENGRISVDKSLLTQIAQEGDAMERFSAIKSFTGSILSKANQVSLNPMEYTQKTVVAYKNPGHNFASPYVTSNYSGMMFSSYC